MNEDEHDGADRQQERIEQEGNDLKRGDGAAELGCCGNGKEHLRTVRDNALENAYEATSELPLGERYIRLSLKQRDNKLLLSLKNTFHVTPKFVNDIPVSSKVDHGIGTQSIIYNCNKLGGQCKFSLENNLFVLQIIV